MSRVTQEIFDASVWATGYGSTRHLIDRDRSRIGVKRGGGTIQDAVQARCSSDGRPVFLDYFDADDRKQFGNPLPQQAYVLRKRPCKRCAKLAEAEGIAL